MTFPSWKTSLPIKLILKILVLSFLMEFLLNYSLISSLQLMNLPIRNNLRYFEFLFCSDAGLALKVLEHLPEIKDFELVSKSLSNQQKIGIY